MSHRILLVAILSGFVAGGLRSDSPDPPPDAQLVLPNAVAAGETATGSVIGPGGHRLAGVVVEVDGRPTTSDESGRFPVAVTAAAGGTVRVRLRPARSDGGEIVVPVVAATAVDLPPLILDLPRYPIAGDLLRVEGSGLSGAGAEVSVRLGERAMPVLASSGTEVVAALPADLMGELPVTVSRAGATSEPVPVVVVGLRLVSGDTRLRRGQRGAAAVVLTGTTEPLPLRVTNATPSVIALEGGETVQVTTSGGDPNQAEVRYRGLVPGDFVLSAEVADAASFAPGAGWVGLQRSASGTQGRVCAPLPAAGRTTDEAAPSTGPASPLPGQVGAAPEGEVLCDALDDAIDRLNGMDHPSRATVEERVRRAHAAMAEVRRANEAVADLVKNVPKATTVEGVRELLAAASEATRSRCPQWSELEAAVRAAEGREAELSRQVAAATERKTEVRVEGMEAWRLSVLLERETYWENFQLAKPFADGFKACQGQMVMAPNAGRARLSAEVFIDVLRDELLQGKSWADARTAAIAQQVADTEKKAGPLGNSKQVIADALRKLADCMEREYRVSLRAWIAGELPGLTPAQLDTVMRIFFDGATAEERRKLEARQGALDKIDEEIAALEKEKKAQAGQLGAALVTLLERCRNETSAEARRLFLYISLLKGYAEYVANHDVIRDGFSYSREPSSFDTLCQRLARIVESPPLPGASEGERQYLRCAFLSICGEPR